MATEYTPQVAVWELTMNCNMRCKHCGSGCEGPIPGELTTDEALALADTLCRMGLRHITLSGGEPFTRPDWHLIAERFVKQGVTVAVITNGWLLDEATVAKAAEVGICAFGISIDGVRETHDHIRKPGSFDRIMGALERLKAHQIPVTAVTCIHKKNLPELEAMREIFVARGITAWQFQAADPMGNLLDHLEWILDPEDIERIIDIAHATMVETPLRVHLADNLGYYGCNETDIRGAALAPDTLKGAWGGCGAGKYVIGIRCTGDIIGCLSIRDDAYIEGNIRETPLEELWNRPGAFAWNRDLTKAQLTGRCHTCQFGARCLAGCGGMKITRFKTVTENPFCAYHAALEAEERTLALVPEAELVARAKALIAEESWQSAEILLRRALCQAPNDLEILNLLGFLHFTMENYPQSLEINRRVLAQAPDNAYAHKGLGLCLTMLNETEAGIQALRKAIDLADPTFTDPYFDLAVVLARQGREAEALEVLDQGRSRSEGFRQQSEAFHQQLTAAR